MLRLIIDLTPIDPAFGLAMEEVLLSSVATGSEDIIRMWINKPSVIIGRSQSAPHEVDLSHLQDLSIPVIRRMSGGGAVYNYEGNLNLSLFLRARNRIGTIRETYEVIGVAIVNALSQLEIPARVEGNAIMLGKNKIAGAAQVRRGSVLLYHTTLLVTLSPIPIESVLLAMQESYRSTFVPSRPRPVTSLSQASPAITIEGLVRPLSDRISLLFGEGIQQGDYTREEMEHAKQLQIEKYGSDEWNLSR